jgi:uncharacterized membrane protein YvbJ
MFCQSCGKRLDENPGACPYCGANSTNIPIPDKQQVTVEIMAPPSPAIGICAFVFGIVSIFIFTIIIMPIALVLSIIACFKKQYGWGIAGLIACIVAALTSPMLWLIFGGSILATR